MHTASTLQERTVSRAAELPRHQKSKLPAPPSATNVYEYTCSPSHPTSYLHPYTNAFVMTISPSPVVLSHD